jgi:hypothetical protein
MPLPVALRGLMMFWLALIVQTSALALQKQIPHQASNHPQFRGRSDVEARILLINVVNMSGQSRQAILGRCKIDLPVGQKIVLQMHAGHTLRVVSDTNSKVQEYFVISGHNATRILAAP